MVKKFDEWLSDLSDDLSSKEEKPKVEIIFFLENLKNEVLGEVKLPSNVVDTMLMPPNLVFDIERHGYVEQVTVWEHNPEKGTFLWCGTFQLNFPDEVSVGDRYQCKYNGQI